MASAFLAKNAWLVPASLASTALVASLGMSTMGAYSASLTNEENTAGTGSLVMTEVAEGGRSTICTSTSGNNNAAVCSSLNKYGGNLDMMPGESLTTDFAMRNDGSVTATAFTLAAGACTEIGTGTACDKMLIQIMDGHTLIFEGSAAQLAHQTFTLQAPVAPSELRPFSVTATVNEKAGNDIQGGAISQPLTWTFTA
ncbi:hypothetical protein CKALI_11085 [Corynebacterium kalinowskii]|uniref:Secreted protein n=1 Tax=Corynebacterium kalinowskii TaxID=2675216 RepID=A0A6B8VVV7_9CORY|nr:hypothetical protein [Corynebacterium kalinowskii]QGU03065.1 hypothetical protein CKALI_11085 [Corynebacterium kalinowskii]